MIQRRSIVMGVIFGILFSFFIISEAGAIPTFARKFRTSCNTCHIAVPKLAAFGETYRLNGYQIPEGDAAYIKEEPVSMGAPAWAKVWPNAVWPGGIPGSVPISIRVMSDFLVNQASSAASTQFDFPHEIEVFTAGLLGENIPFFAEIEFEGGSTATEAWLGYYNLLSNMLPERALNLKVGNLMLNPLPMANDHLRIGKNHYLYKDWRVPSSDNDFRLRDSRAGVELNGIVASRIYYSGGLVQGDNTNDKDGFVTLRYKFGGIPFDSSAPSSEGLDEAISGRASGFWVDNAIEIAGFGYAGTTEVGSPDLVNDKFYRWGVGLRGTYQNLDVSGGFVWGNNNDPFAANSTYDVDSRAWFVEGGYVFFPWLIGNLRYETLELDDPADYVVTDMDRRRWVPGLILQVRPNIKLVAEGLIYDQFDETTDDPDNFAARLDVSY